MHDNAIHDVALACWSVWLSPIKRAAVQTNLAYRGKLSKPKVLTTFAPCFFTVESYARERQQNPSLTRRAFGYRITASFGNLFWSASIAVFDTDVLVRFSDFRECSS